MRGETGCRAPPRAVFEPIVVADHTMKYEKTPIHSTAPTKVAAYHLRERGFRTSGSVR